MMLPKSGQMVVMPAIKKRDAILSKNALRTKMIADCHPPLKRLIDSRSWGCVMKCFCYKSEGTPSYPWEVMGKNLSLQTGPNMA